MAISTFSPTTHPDWSGFQRKFKPRVLMAAFGDGYSQRAGDGNNSNPLSVSASWSNLTQAEHAYIDGFFSTCAGVTAFFYTYVDETVPKVYVCTEWSSTHEGAGIYSMSASLVQVYDIG